MKKNQRDVVKFTGTRQAVESSIAIAKDDKRSTWENMALRHSITQWKTEDSNTAKSGTQGK